MHNLFEMFARAQSNAAMDMFSRQFKLTPQQTEAAVEALLPAFIAGLQRMSSSPEGMFKLYSLMARSSYQSLLNNPAAALTGASGEEAGKAAVSTLFGSPEFSRSIAAQATQFAGVGPAILEKMVPLMAAMVMGGLSQYVRPSSGEAAELPAAAPSRPESAQTANPANQPATTPSGAQPSPGEGGAASIERDAGASEQAGEAPQPALFDQMFEAGRNIQQAHVDNMRRILDAFLVKPDREPPK